MPDWINLPPFDPGPSGPPSPAPTPGFPAATGSRGGGEVDRRTPRFLLPHEDTFASKWQQGFRTYWYRSDEALRRSHADALAMRRDPLIHACLRRRQLPTSAVPFAVEPEDPDDPAQRVAARVISQLVERIPRFQSLKLGLLEAIFYGRAGAQIRYGPVTVEGIRLVGVRDHHPISGDKVVRRWGGTPGVLVNAAWANSSDPQAGPRPWMRPYIDYSGNFGYTLWLARRELRDRFVIHAFEPTDTDYLYEGDMAGAVYGMGLRSRLWHPWNLRNEVASWALDALQKIGANGLLYARYPHGQEDYADKVLEMLAKLSKDHLAAVPYTPGQSGDERPIDTIPVNAVGYDILATFQNIYEGYIREIINGDSPTAAPSADTRKSAELTEDTRMSYLRADAVNLQETLTEQLVAPLLRLNRGAIEELTGAPVRYKVRLKLQIDRPNALEDLQTAQLLMGVFAAMGVRDFPIDPGHLIDISGLRPPEGGTIGREIRRIEEERAGIAAPPGEPAAPPPGVPEPGGGEGEPPAPPPGGARMPTGEAPADGSPPDPIANTPRPTANRGGDPGRYAGSRRILRP